MNEEIRQYLSEEDIAYFESLGINLKSELLDPKIDSVFRAIFTANSKESIGALTNLLSSRTTWISKS